MSARFDTRQAWEAAVGAAASQASVDLGMDPDEARSYAERRIGPCLEPRSPSFMPTEMQMPLMPLASPGVPAARVDKKTQEPVKKPMGKSTATAARPEVALPRDDSLRKPAKLAKPPAAGASANRAEGNFAMAAAGVALTAAYCVAELCYNMSLVEFVSSANTSADAFENLERVGKMLGAVGLSMAFSKALFNGRRALAVFALMAPLAYLGIDYGFDAYIDGLPHEQKVEGYYLGAYRSLVLSGKLADQDFDGPQSSTERKIKLLNLSLAAGSGKDPQARVAQYVFGDESVDTFDNEIESLWGIYSSIARKVDPLYGYYAIESRKVAAHAVFQDKYAAGFAKRSGGIPPGLSKEQFNAEIQKQYPGLARYRATIAIPAQPSIGMPALAMGDIPAGLDQPSFRAFFKAHFAKARDAKRAAADRVEAQPQAKGVIGATLVPPLSMSLSLLSFGLNLAGAIAGLGMLLLWPMRMKPAYKKSSRFLKGALTVGVVGWLATAPSALSGSAGAWQSRAAKSSLAGALWSRAINAESAVVSSAGSALPAIHRMFIDDAHPDEVKRATIEKAQAVDLGDLDSKIAKLKSASEKEDAPQAVDPSFYCEEKRLGEKGYYCEMRPEGGNPYTKK